MMIPPGMMIPPTWLRLLGFPSTYGCHALDALGHCHTKDPGDYVGHHRKEAA